MRIFNPFLFLVLTFVAVFFSACSENPNITGYDLLNPLDSLILTRYDSTLDSSFVNSHIVYQTENFGDLRRFLVGQSYSDELGITERTELHSLLNFNFFLSTSLKEALKQSQVSVISAQLKLTPVYTFKDQNISGSFYINVKEILNAWDSDTLTANGFDALLISEQRIDLGNADNDSIYYVQLDPVVVLEWLKNASKDTVKEFNGILLSPSLNTNYIKGFASINSNYQDEPTLLEIVIDNNQDIDTLKLTVRSDVHVAIPKLLSGTGTNSQEYLEIQSAIKTKSFLFFDISKVPRNAIVNSAYLRLYLDSTKSKFGTSYQDSIYVQLVRDPNRYELDSSSAYSLVKTPEGYYQANISFYVERWINDNSNRGLLLTTKDPDGGFEKFVFHGPKTLFYDKRPRLIINYSYKK